MRFRSLRRAAVAAVVLALVAVACSSKSGGGNTGGGPGKAGGSIVLGAEQWPQCLNPITDCAAASWYLYTVQEFVFPRLVQWTNNVQQTPSDLITDIPSLANGGITNRARSRSPTTEPQGRMVGWNRHHLR